MEGKKRKGKRRKEMVAEQRKGKRKSKRQESSKPPKDHDFDEILNFEGSSSHPTWLISALE